MRTDAEVFFHQVLPATTVLGNLVPAGVAAEDGAKGNEDDSLCIMYPATLHTGVVAFYLTGDDD